MNGHLSSEPECIGGGCGAWNYGLSTLYFDLLNEGRRRWRTRPETALDWSSVGSAADPDQYTFMGQSRERLIHGCPRTEVEELFG